jgi:protein arginine phosphatase
MNGPHVSTKTPESQASLLRRGLRAIVPRRLRAERGVMLRLGPRAGRAYLKLRILGMAGFGSSNLRKAPPDARSIVFVCFGNIMRSPMAERMFKRSLVERGIEGIQVKSAGIHATPGSEAHPRAKVAAGELGLPLDDHHSQLLTNSMVDEADAIFAMDFQNKAELLALFPQAQEKIFMLGAYADGAKQQCEIADPYFGDQDEARQCYRILQACIDNLAESLSAKGSSQEQDRGLRTASTQV